MEQEIRQGTALKEALRKLLEKYGISAPQPYSLCWDDLPIGSLRLLPGNLFMESALAHRDVPLLSWRTRRTFRELRQIVGEAVVENACLLRFSYFAPPGHGSLASLVYREIDLFEYIGGGKVESVFAVWGGRHTVNLIVKAFSGLLGCIEISLQLPPGVLPQERHEVIGRRGTACDRVVDTQVPQHSVYFFGRGGDQQYTDTDGELFDFDQQATDHVRGALELFKSPGLKDVWMDQHRHLVEVVRASIESGRTVRKVVIS